MPLNIVRQLFWRNSRCLVWLPGQIQKILNIKLDRKFSKANICWAISYRDVCPHLVFYSESKIWMGFVANWMFADKSVASSGNPGLSLVRTTVGHGCSWSGLTLDIILYQGWQQHRLGTFRTDAMWWLRLAGREMILFEPSFARLVGSTTKELWPDKGDCLFTQTPQ